MTGVPRQHPQPPRCAGYGDAHYLTCPTLRLPVCRCSGHLHAWHITEGECTCPPGCRQPVTLLEASRVMNQRLVKAAEAGLSVREAVAAWSRGEER